MRSTAVRTPSAFMEKNVQRVTPENFVDTKQTSSNVCKAEMERFMELLKIGVHK